MYDKYIKYIILLNLKFDWLQKKNTLFQYFFENEKDNNKSTPLQLLLLNS